MAKCKGLVKFEEVAVVFSEDEWNLLSDQQRGLYMEVMKENYEHLIYLGYEVPVILSLLQDGGGISSDAGSQSKSQQVAVAEAGSNVNSKVGGNIPETLFSNQKSKGPQGKKTVHWKDEEMDTNWSGNSHDENEYEQSPTSPYGRSLRKRKQYYCHDCEKCFKHSSALEAHRRVHSGDKPHQCDICKETFSYKSALIVHRRLHSQASTSKSQEAENQKPIVVKILPVTPSTVNTTPETQPVSTTDVIVTAASTPVVNNQGFNLNNTSNNLSYGEKPHKCNYCDKRFNDLSILEAHHRIHTGKLAYPCTMCDQSFSKPSLLAAHNNTHKEGKPYQCDQCDKNFNDQSLLVAHKRTHTGEKPHKCSHCNKWFPNRTSLIAHEECHLKPKPYKCKHCEKSFNDKSLLITHEGVHTDTKPFKCNQCPESFFLKTQLMVHQATHAPEKPFPCSQCERSFNKKETLLAHIRVHNLQNVQTQKPHRQ
ncbi:zinc finger protein 182 isoform X2 [Xenopus laevis]|uniref:Zinc finger protein 182 isoform X2 n=1 Tax=Xenopus laevis TaxID=8355 RepID=A0A8J0VMF4_XENLA|nr:zinc finger protein 182 isoform X2 [Xenopus laevis]